MTPRFFDVTVLRGRCAGMEGWCDGIEGQMEPRPAKAWCDGLEGLDRTPGVTVLRVLDRETGVTVLRASSEWLV